jgi:4-diphosphocytidyl-2C-methyl-D-erythritol kinase
MPEETPEPLAQPTPPSRTKDEIALELTKFIAVATGFGKGSANTAGFSSKLASRSAEEHAEAILALFERCRAVVNK